MKLTGAQAQLEAQCLLGNDWDVEFRQVASDGFELRCANAEQNWHGCIYTTGAVVGDVRFDSDELTELVNGLLEGPPPDVSCVLQSTADARHFEIGGLWRVVAVDRERGVITLGVGAA